MPDRRPTAAERQERLAAIRAQQQRARNRRTWLFGSIAGVLVLGLIGVSIAVIWDAGREQAAQSAAAERDIDGVEVIDGLTFNHVSTTVDYPQTPPAGGDHNAAWLNCGVYTEPVPNENAVHALEHGAVWITYSPDLPADQVTTLEAMAKGQSYVLVSPYEDMDTPIAISAWGYQLKVDDAADPRLATFVQKYLLNPELAEVGAPCSNGVGVPA